MRDSRPSGRDRADARVVAGAWQAVNIIMVKVLRNRPSVATLPVILTGLSVIGLVSGCSGTQTAQSTGANPYSNAPSQNPERLAGIGSVTVVTVHGKIIAVDRSNKLVTFQSMRGKTITVQVDNPYNLAAAKPGEPFVARFYEIATIREMQPGELIPSASLQEGIVSAMPGQTPGAAFGNQLQIVATIDATNSEKSIVSIKGPDGSVETVAVSNPEILANVRLGDQVVITLSNVVAIALDKEPGAP